MKLEKLLSMKSYEILEEDYKYNSMVLKAWNRLRPERVYFYENRTRERYLYDTHESFLSAIRDAKKAVERLEGFSVGDIVEYTEGYNCTLHQFAQFVKRTPKFAIFQKFEYQGMSCIAKPTKLVDEFIRVPAHKINQYNDFRPWSKYYNNED